MNYYLQRGAIGGAFRLIPTEIKLLIGARRARGRGSEFAKLPARPRARDRPRRAPASRRLLARAHRLVNSTRADHLVDASRTRSSSCTRTRSRSSSSARSAPTPQSFANALQHVLRQDPDVILIGERRDLETISVALTAAGTGHLVFATLHTQDAGQTIDRVDRRLPRPTSRARCARSSPPRSARGRLPDPPEEAPGAAARWPPEIMVTAGDRQPHPRGRPTRSRSALQAGRAQGMNTMDQHLAELVNTGSGHLRAAVEKAHDQEDFKRLAHRTSDATRPPRCSTISGATVEHDADSTPQGPGQRRQGVKEGRGKAQRGRGRERDWR